MTEIVMSVEDELTLMGLMLDGASMLRRTMLYRRAERWLNSHDRIDAPLVAQAIGRIIGSESREIAVLVLVEERRVLIRELCVGDGRSVEIDEHDVLQQIEFSDAIAAFLCHSHAGTRDSRPSKDDLKYCAALRKDVEALDVEFDEIVIARHAATSIRHRKRIELGPRRRR